MWLELHAAPLISAGSRKVAVIIDPAHPAHISSLLMSAYRLTEREQQVTSLVLRGRSTSQIASQLVLSPLTVQEHLKAVFEKTDVCSRLELVGRIYFDHYEPRVRDNERRAINEQPVRGGPMSTLSRDSRS
jgi:DNA-binding NarL/FixJ family response regulator